MLFTATDFLDIRLILCVQAPRRRPVEITPEIQALIPPGLLKDTARDAADSSAFPSEKQLVKLEQDFKKSKDHLAKFATKAAERVDRAAHEMRMYEQHMAMQGEAKRMEAAADRTEAAADRTEAAAAQVGKDRVAIEAAADRASEAGPSTVNNITNIDNSRHLHIHEAPAAKRLCAGGKLDGWLK
tara:strand:+ start:794 stop:1348 length:555 start_codon:yes stop_codon:yes gene_type:complete